MLRWQPDLGAYQPPGPHQKIFNVTGFFPTNRGGMKTAYDGTATAYTTACNGFPTGAALLTKSDGTNRLFAGSNLRLEEANGAGGWTNQSASTYSTSTIWTFAQFGDDTIATNGVNDPQISSTGGFVALSGSPPKGKFVVVQNNIALLFNINDGTSRPDWWASSDQNDPRTWTAAATNFADKDRLYGGVGGPITAATAFRDEVIAWKSSAMYRGRFTNDLDRPWVWEFISQTHGSPAPLAHADTEVGLVYLTERDVMLYDGSHPRSIADDVRKLMFSAIGANASTAFCSIDEPNNCVWFWFLTEGGSGYPDQAYIWNWKTGLWGRHEPAGNLTAATTPVRGARYPQFSSSPISGGTNSAQIANLVFAGDDAKLYNMRGSLAAAVSLAFWEQGYLDRDLRLNKHRAAFVPSDKPSSASLTLQPLSSGLVIGTSQTVSMQPDFSFGGSMSARYFGATFGLVAGQSGELLELIPEYMDYSNPAKPVSLK